MPEHKNKLKLTREVKKVLEFRYSSSSIADMPTWASSPPSLPPTSPCSYCHTNKANTDKWINNSNYPPSFLNKIGEDMLNEIIGKLKIPRSSLNPSAVEFVSRIVSQAVVVPK